MVISMLSPPTPLPDGETQAQGGSLLIRPGDDRLEVSLVLGCRDGAVGALDAADADALGEEAALAVGAEAGPVDPADALAAGFEGLLDRRDVGGGGVAKSRRLGQHRRLDVVEQ